MILIFEVLGLSPMAWGGPESGDHIKIRQRSPEEMAADGQEIRCSLCHAPEGTTAEEQFIECELHPQTYMHRACPDELGGCPICKGVNFRAVPTRPRLELDLERGPPLDPTPQFGPQFGPIMRRIRSEAALRDVAAQIRITGPLLRDIRRLEQIPERTPEQEAELNRHRTQLAGSRQTWAVTHNGQFRIDLTFGGVGVLGLAMLGAIQVVPDLPPTAIYGAILGGYSMMVSTLGLDGLARRGIHIDPYGALATRHAHAFYRTQLQKYLARYYQIEFPNSREFNRWMDQQFEAGGSPPVRSCFARMVNAFRRSR